jgi:hypothetical protein
MIRSLIITFVLYIAFTFILPLPLDYNTNPIVGPIPISMIIAIIVGLIEYLYRLSIPSENWKPWDVLALVIVSLTLIYGYTHLNDHLYLAIFFCILSLVSYVFIKVIYNILIRESWDKYINWSQAYRNHFALPILVAFMFVPVSITMTMLSENEVSSVQTADSPFDQNFDRETMILEYLVVKYPNISTFDQWSEDRIVEFFQDIEFIEANVAHRVPSLVILKSMKSSTFASYNFEGNLIRVNSKYIKDATLDEWIDSILHEGRHSYQFQLIMQINWDDPIVINSPQFSEFNKIFQEFMDYNDGSEGEFEVYYNQFIEVDARQFSDEILPIYIVLLLAP